jgi:hypothetical protein
VWETKGVRNIRSTYTHTGSNTWGDGRSRTRHFDRSPCAISNYMHARKWICKCALRRATLRIKHSNAALACSVDAFCCAAHAKWKTFVKRAIKVAWFVVYLLLAQVDINNGKCHCGWDKRRGQYLLFRVAKFGIFCRQKIQLFVGNNLSFDCDFYHQVYFRFDLVHRSRRLTIINNLCNFFW